MTQRVGLSHTHTHTHTHVHSEDGYLLQLERDLRAMLLKISVCDALLQPNPPGKLAIS